MSTEVPAYKAEPIKGGTTVSVENPDGRKVHVTVNEIGLLVAVECTRTVGIDRKVIALSHSSFVAVCKCYERGLEELKKEKSND